MTLNHATRKMEPGSQLTEAELVEVETQAQPKKPGNTKGPGSHIDDCPWWNEAEPVLLRTEAEPGGRRSTTELKRWRDEVFHLRQAPPKAGSLWCRQSHN